MRAALWPNGIHTGQVTQQMAPHVQPKLYQGVVVFLVVLASVVPVQRAAATSVTVRKAEQQPSMRLRSSGDGMRVFVGEDCCGERANCA
jgi:hypothetical protein